MNILVCIKRVPAPGARIVLTEDRSAIETRHLGFTMSPHEECAVEEAVRIIEREGGTATILTLGPPEAEEQLRQAISLGAHRGVLVGSDAVDPPPEAVAAAIAAAVRSLDERYDLLLFGNESADAGNHQVGIRVAHALDLPVVAGIKGIDLADGVMTLRRQVPDGYEVYEVPLPAAATVKEGLNLPRYPSMSGRLKARKAEILRLPAELPTGGMRRLRFAEPEQQESRTTVLGHGPEAAPAVVDLLDELELL